MPRTPITDTDLREWLPVAEVDAAADISARRFKATEVFALIEEVQELRAWREQVFLAVRQIESARDELLRIVESLKK